MIAGSYQRLTTAAALSFCTTYETEIAGHRRLYNWYHGCHSACDACDKLNHRKFPHQWGLLIWSEPEQAQHTEANFSSNLLCLRVPRSQDMVIFVLMTTTTRSQHDRLPYPPVHASVTIPHKDRALYNATVTVLTICHCMPAGAVVLRLMSYHWF